MKKLLIISALLLSSCSSLQFKFNTLNTVAHHAALYTVQQPNVTVYTTTHQVFSNMDPWDFGLRAGGNWIHCRYHGFHDLNNWTDFTYSPYFCRPTRGFISGSSWNNNWNWGGYNYWNPRHRFNYWGNNWSPWMGNVHYGYGNNYYGWGQQNTWYWSNGYYGGSYMYGRRSNMNGRRGSLLGAYSRTTTINGRAHASMIESTKRTTKPRRVIRTTPTRTNTPTRVIRTRPTRTQTLQNNVRPPMRTVTPPINNTPNNIRPVRTNTRTTTQPRRSKPTNVKKDNLK